MEMVFPLSNAAIPTLLLAWPALAAWVLVFAVLAEAFCYTILLRVPFAKALRASAKANVVSSVLGLPIAGIIAILVTLLLSSVINLEETQVGRFFLPMAFITDIPTEFQLASALGFAGLLIFFLVVSVRIERGYIESLVDEEFQSGARRAVWAAHAFTYAPVIAWAMFSILRS